MPRDEGIERQLARCRKAAKSLGWTIVAEYSDNATSAFRVRGASTQWHQMIQDFKANKFTHLLGTDMDRFLRSMRDLLLLQDLGVKARTIDNHIDLITPEGILQASMSAMMAEFETRKKSQRQKYANEYRVSLGMPVPGRRRFGYETDGITIRPGEAKVVKRVFKDVIAGKSLRGISQALIAEEISSGTRGGWRPARIREMILNPSYAGKLKHLGQVHEESKIAPIVTLETFEKANAILADPTRRTSPGGTRRHLASGLALCGICSNPLSFRNGYACLKDLSHPFIKKEYMEERVSEEVFFWVVQHPDPTSSATISSDSGEAITISNALTAAESKRQRFETLYLDGSGDLASHLKKIHGLDKEITELRNRLVHARGVVARSEIIEVIRGDWWKNKNRKEYTELEERALVDWGKYWQKLDLEKQREIISTTLEIRLFPGIGPERVEISWKDDPKTKAKSSRSRR